jgi:hypothetical protein
LECDHALNRGIELAIDMSDHSIDLRFDAGWSLPPASPRTSGDLSLGSALFTARTSLSLARQG